MRNSQLNERLIFMKDNNAVLDKSKAFALRTMRLFNYLSDNYRIAPVANQILKSGTSIGANAREAVRAQSKPDFYSKLNIALKESSETEYWLEILFESGYISREQFDSMYSDCKELTKLLTAITKTQKIQ